jgi:F-type H+-transporting ATPase subunit b
MLINPYTIVLQLINIGILFYFLRRFLFQPLRDFLEKRRENIREQYKEAERQKLESQKLYDEYRRRIEDSQEEIRSMIKVAQKQANDTRRGILDQARQEAEEFMSKARDEMERQKNKISRELMEQSMDFSLVLASKVLEQKISKEEHHEIIRQIMDRMGESKWVQ